MFKCGKMATRAGGSVTTVAVISLFFISAGFSQDSLKGRVVEAGNKPVKDAKVELIRAKLSETTDSEGRFTIKIPVAVISSIRPVFEIHSFRNGILSFNAAAHLQKVSVEVFDNKGRVVNRAVRDGFGEGTYSLNIIPRRLPAAVYYIKLQTGNHSSVFNLLNLNNRQGTLPGKGSCIKNALSKRASGSTNVIDTLEISKDGYITAQTGVTSYSSDVDDIILKVDYTNFELPPITNGQSATTTRYWDCCKPHCAWQATMKMCKLDGSIHDDNTSRNGKNGCENGGVVFQCWNYAPIEINDKVSYGWAAFNDMGAQCGQCYQLAFEGALQGKQMIVQFINIGDGGANSFDLMIPGGGVGMLNGCSSQWGNKPLGVQYGGFLASCGPNKDCILGMCETAFGDKEDLMRGCRWFLEWFKMADNPNVKFMKVSCPQEIKDISGIGN